jgi:hypothetical protein
MRPSFAESRASGQWGIPLHCDVVGARSDHAVGIVDAQDPAADTEIHRSPSEPPARTVFESDVGQ